MHIVWWILTGIFVFMGIVGFTGIINPNFFNKQKKEGEQPFTRKLGSLMFVVSLIGSIIFISLVNQSPTMSKAKQPLTPDQKVDKDLENIVITNVLELSNSKLSHLTFKNNTDDGNYTVGGIVSGIDQSGKKVEYDFSAFTDGSNVIQWTIENTSTYKVETGTVNTSNGSVTKND